MIIYNIILLFFQSLAKICVRRDLFELSYSRSTHGLALRLLGKAEIRVASLDLVMQLVCGWWCKEQEYYVIGRRV